MNLKTKSELVFAWVRSQSFPDLVNSDQPKQMEGNKANTTSKQIGNNLDMKDTLDKIHTQSVQVRVKM
jgi:hypothetical protein